MFIELRTDKMFRI